MNVHVTISIDERTTIDFDRELGPRPGHLGDIQPSLTDAGQVLDEISRQVLGMEVIDLVPAELADEPSTWESPGDPRPLLESIRDSAALIAAAMTPTPVRLSQWVAGAEANQEG